MAPRRIHYGTPSQFQAVTHARLEHFDNKPPPQPLEESEPTVKVADQSVNMPGQPSESRTASAQSAGNASTATKSPTETQAAGEEVWKPDRGGGWDGKVTQYDAKTMYLG